MSGTARNVSDRRRMLGALAAPIAVALAAAAHGAPLAGPWSIAAGYGDGPISNTGPGTLTVGQLSPPNSATQEMLSAAFPAITLAKSGDQIVFTGSVTLTGTVNSPATEGFPRNQFRFGLFDGDQDDFGWVGYSMSNKHGVSASGGDIVLKPAGNTSAYLAIAGQTVLASQGGDGSASSLFHDGAYSLNMTLQRVGSDLNITSSLIGTNGFSQTMTVTHANASGAGTLAFDRFGFLLGQNLSTDMAVFQNLDVAFVPAPETLALQVLASGPAAGAMRILNSTADDLDFSYYEIRSAGGSLNPADWRSLDDQDPASPPQGWGEAGGVSTHLLAEARFLGQSTVVAGDALPLGRGYAGPTNDLEFFIGNGGPLMQGDVEFVDPGDFNADGRIDASDLARWSTGAGATSDHADADFDGDSDGADFLAWQRHVGSTATSAAVPEPAAGLLGAMALGVAFGLQQSLGVRRRGGFGGRLR